MTRTIAVVNHKGGSTKTTSTVNLAQALVEAGYTVRVVDLDPQCNATTWLGATPEAVDNDVLSVLMMVASIEDATTITASGIHLVPATKELDSVGPYFLKKPGAHGVLRKALAGAPDVDFNLLDCPGDFDHLTISALVACTDVLAAVMTGAMELEALMRIENYISEQVELLNPTARLNHILCGRVELGQIIDQQVLAALRETYPRSDDAHHHPEVGPCQRKLQRRRTRRQVGTVVVGGTRLPRRRPRTRRKDVLMSATRKPGLASNPLDRRPQPRAGAHQVGTCSRTRRKDLLINVTRESGLANSPAERKRRLPNLVEQGVDVAREAATNGETQQGPVALDEETTTKRVPADKTLESIYINRAKVEGGKNAVAAIGHIAGAPTVGPTSSTRPSPATSPFSNANTTMANPSRRATPNASGDHASTSPPRRSVRSVLHGLKRIRDAQSVPAGAHR